MVREITHPAILDSGFRQNDKTIRMGMAHPTFIGVLFCISLGLQHRLPLSRMLVFIAEI